MPMNNRLLRPLQTPGLLDLVPGAAAAYSLRSLSRSYAGPVVTVRRSSDDAEEDFKASEIDDGTLAAFCGAGDGFVKTWFDQSGNGNDASQATAGYQPKIVSSGSLVTEGGKAALEFDGTDDWFIISSLDTPQPITFFIVGTRSSVSPKANFFDGNAGYRVLFEISPTTNLDSMYAGKVGGLAANAPPTTAQAMYSLVYNGASSYGHRDGALFIPIGDVGSLSTQDLYVGRDTDASDLLTGTIQELIIYPSDQSANRQRIEGDLAWYY